MIPGYAELHCVSCYTFLRGASSPEELVHRADELGYGALAITDECSVAGIVRAHVAAKDLKMKLIVGSELTLERMVRAHEDAYRAVAAGRPLSLATPIGEQIAPPKRASRLGTLAACARSFAP